ncbi:TonB-dependent receptor [Sphingomonas donggukensis]|uniref:TonB-dependent receptor n=1 Tax=Sphingomonas donggukensis TaxID=2949093 RepID=A0ABY4TQJ0_9SPHN|nr:TonB-dependent receptor [Sphingomonas donggukensis]URW74482.1 TonB-dependent receptor [Sphingomonas donggukensis]
MKTVRHAIGTVSMGALALALATPAHAQATDPQTTGNSTPAPQTTTDAPAPADDQGEDIVVTGFRASLDAALNVKRLSVGAVDAIVAEDIAKFPDQNLAESLQRIPGISIQRDGGEGRAITVRGLGAQFTRVRVNGMETVATSSDGASANRDRAFDFNVFASELFNSIVVHKTAEASLDEGSLGAVVDLNTGNPLGGKTGFTLVGSANASYNDLSKTWGPRVAGLLSWKSPNGDFGVAVSAAYQKTDTLELGNNTVRWSQAYFDSVGGTPCFYNSTGNAATGVTYTTPAANSGGSYRPSAACDQAALAFHPRIPRYGEVGHDRERLGITGSIQWSPSDATKVSIDGLFSRFKEDREEKWGEVLLRSNERSIDVTNPVYDTSGNMIAATLNDAWVRTEHYLRQSNTKFYQVGGSWDQDVSDRFRFTVMGGVSKSDANIPVETTFVFDDRDAQNYSYDYRDMEFPKLTFGTSVTDPANFQLAEIRDRPSNVTNKFRTAQLRTEWDVVPDAFTIKAGGVYRRFSFDSKAFTRDTVVCGNGGVDRVLGTLTCSASSAFGPTAVYGFPATNLGELFTLGNAGQPSGTTTQFLIPDIQKSADFTKLYSRALAVDAGNTRSVIETVSGGYLQFDAKGDIFGLRYAANAGVRYVHTDQSSSGLSSGAPVTVERTYDDWLPSMNVALFPTDDIILRGAIAKVITRPSLGNLTPGGSVDGFNYNVSFGNPNLLPFRATAFDLAAEWYFARGSILSVALFKKDVESFPIGVTRSGTFASTGLPTSIIPPSSPAALNPEGRLWNITSITNGTGASLKGVELSLQTQFTFLPGFLKHFGAIANATFIDSSATYRVNGAIATACVRNATTGLCALGPNVQADRTTTLFGLSKKAFNGTLYYEDKKFSARVSGSFREGYVDANSGTGNVFEGYGDTLNVDASVRYKLTPWVEVSVEGVNLTDEYRFRYTDLDAQRNYENNHFGRTILVGARFKL